MARWHSCNIVHLAPDASRLWQFDAKGGQFALGREHRTALDAPLPFRAVAKSWSSLWQPRLNIAWLPPEQVFLRVVELPASNLEETRAMVELQLEKLSPLPVTQIVWTFHVMPRRDAATAKPEAAPAEENKTEALQTVVVVIAERSAVEEFLGRLEARGFLADRLEAPMLDQLEVTLATEARAAGQDDTTADAWVFPVALAGQKAALVAWQCSGALRNLSYVTLPAAGGQAANLKAQLMQLAWAGELEGWMAASRIQWHVVGDPVGGAEWENYLREALGEPVTLVPPVPPVELAAHTARRAAADGALTATLLPEEFPARYHQQFVDRLWLRGLITTGVLYAVGVAIYFCATTVLGYRTRAVEQQVAALKGAYTTAMQLKARYDVLKERQDLKYAALDCWKIVAEQLPTGITLQRLSFSDGQTLFLSGTTTPDQINTLFDFNSAMQKAAINNQPMFDTKGGETVNPRLNNGTEYWNFSLKLLHTGESQ